MRRSRTIAFLACTSLSAVAADPPPTVPDPVKTPGDVLTTQVKTLCAPGSTKPVEEVPPRIKDQIYQSYGIASHQPGEYEIDHLISIELGGSNSVRNLWPQSYQTTPLNAHVKNTLENKLHELICAGKLDLQQAQQDIARNWLAAYQKYVGSLPGDVQVPPTREPPVADEFPGSSPRHAKPNPDEPARSPDAKRPGDQSMEPGYPPVPPDASGRCPAAAPVRISASGSYHVPGSPSYEHTKAKLCFATREAAEGAGYRAPKR